MCSVSSSIVGVFSLLRVSLSCSLCRSFFFRIFVHVLQFVLRILTSQVAKRLLFLNRNRGVREKSGISFITFYWAEAINKATKRSFSLVITQSTKLRKAGVLNSKSESSWGSSKSQNCESFCERRQTRTGKDLTPTSLQTFYLSLISSIGYSLFWKAGLHSYHVLLAVSGRW